MQQVVELGLLDSQALWWCQLIKNWLPVINPGLHPGLSKGWPVGPILYSRVVYKRQVGNPEPLESLGKLLHIQGTTAPCAGVARLGPGSGFAPGPLESALPPVKQ